MGPKGFDVLRRCENDANRIADFVKQQNKINDDTIMADNADVFGFETAVSWGMMDAPAEPALLAA